jgi:hypothetical protein
MDGIWSVTVTKRDLVDAVRHARMRSTLRKVSGGFEDDVTLTGCPAGLSIRSNFAATDIPAAGTWPSPIMTHGATLRRLASKLAGPEIEIAFGDGHLLLNTTSLSAREA